MLTPFQLFLNCAKRVVSKSNITEYEYNGVMVPRIISMNTKTLPDISRVQHALEKISPERQERLLYHTIEKVSFFSIRYIKTKK